MGVKRPVQDLKIVLDCMQKIAEVVTEPPMTLSERPTYTMEDIVNLLEYNKYNHYLLYKPNQCDIDVRKTIENAALALVSRCNLCGYLTYKPEDNWACVNAICKIPQEEDPESIYGSIAPLTAVLYYLMDKTAPSPSRTTEELAQLVGSSVELVEAFLYNVPRKFMREYPGRIPIPWPRMITRIVDPNDSSKLECRVHMFFAKSDRGPEVEICNSGRIDYDD